MKIELNGQEITVEVIRKPNKNIYMRFSSPFVLCVSCNSYVSLKEISRILDKNHHSLEKMQRKKEEETIENSFFWYLGKCYTRVFDEECKEVSILSDCVFARDEAMLEKFYQSEVRRIFVREVENILPSFSDVPFFTLKFRKMKTRWGVNHLTGKTITLNTELLKKDLDLLQYVIIHELCHFYEANHSNRFWQQVKRFYPNYKEARRRLRG